MHHKIKKAPHHVEAKAIKSVKQVGPLTTSSLTHAHKSLTKGKKLGSAHAHGHTSPVAI